jgi:hypothetical protein
MTIVNENVDSDFKLLKTMRYGPMTTDHYLEYRSEVSPKKKEELEFLISKVRRENPWLYMIIEVAKYYLINKKEIRIDTQFLALNRVPKRVAARQNIPKFGDAVKDNHTTTICSPVYMTPPGVDSDEYAKKMNKEYKELELKYNFFKTDKYGVDTENIPVENDNKVSYNKGALNDVHDRIANKNAKSKFKIFKPSGVAMNIMKKIENDDSLSESTSGMKKTGGYLPPGMKRLPSGPKNPDNVYSVVVKNIPQHVDSRDAEYLIRRMFETYGEISRIKVLRDNSENEDVRNRGIAFVDFFYKEAVENAINDTDTHRRTIEHMVLGVEEKKERKN